MGRIAVCGSSVTDLERYQRRAAERLLDDEGWRDALQDSEAAPLLAWALDRTDASIARAAAVLDDEAALDEHAGAVAGHARALLAALAQVLRQRSVQDTERALSPWELDLGPVEALMGPPLFESADSARAAILEALATALAAGSSPGGSF